jgi:osmotically-inducible protein OsmY
MGKRELHSIISGWHRTGTELARLLRLWLLDSNLRGRNQHMKIKTIVTALLMMTLMGCQSMTGKTAGRNVDDATITASVKSTLVADKAANLTRVDVDTNNGVVALNGVVESGEQKTRAEQLARRVDGVRNVVNNLQIQKRTS